MLTGRIIIMPVICLLLLAGIGSTLQAQLSFQFIPALYGQSVNGLFTAQVQNTGLLSYNGTIAITLRDGRGKMVLKAQTPKTMIRAGLNTIQLLAAQTSLQFGNGSAAASIVQTGRFPEDDYEYCFVFNGAEEKPNGAEQFVENCFNYSVQPVSPMNLVSPADGDQACNSRPAFIWQPAMPVVSTYRYSLQVTEQQEQQAAADAIASNIPVFRQDNINGFMLNYPMRVKELQKDKKYVWQVNVYEGNMLVTRSAIWTLEIRCNDPKKDSSADSYRFPAGTINGNYYSAKNGVLQFSLNNPYGITALQYAIAGIASPNKKITNLPSVKVQTGLNKIDLVLEDIHGLQPGHMYLLRISNIGDHILYLPFTYSADETR
jgi:hypothetical protein